jgi:ribose transport system substrate-binding protein
MSRQNRVWRLALLLMVIVMLVTPLAQAAEPRKPNIVFLPGDSSDPFYITMQQGAKQAADLMRVNLITPTPLVWDVTAQTTAIDAAVAGKDIDFMFVSPVDVYGMVQPLKRASDAGIPLLTVDMFIGTGEYGKPDDPIGFPLSYIASDNVQGGKIAAEALAKALGGKGKVYLQNVTRGISSLDQREQGFTEGIKEFPGMTLVGVDFNDGDASVGRFQTEAMLKREPDLAGIFAITTPGAQAAANALKKAGLSGKVKVVAFDATAEAIELLKDGAVDLVIAQKPGEMGFMAVEAAMAALNGYTDIPKRITTGYALIDKSNMNDPNVTRWVYKGSAQ